MTSVPAGNPEPAGASVDTLDAAVGVLLFAVPVLPGRTDDFCDLCDELRERRDEFTRSRQRVGVTREISWLQRDGAGDLAILYLAAGSAELAIRSLASSDDPFDEWFAGRVDDIFGRSAPWRELPESEIIVDRRADDVSDLDEELVQYLALAARLKPGLADQLRWLARNEDVHADHEQEYLALLGLHELQLWLQPTAVGDLVVYFASGDVARSTEVLATSDDPKIAVDRDFLAEFYGLDAEAEGFPIPQPTFAWSA